jgi:hypothetical protein
MKKFKKNWIKMNEDVNQDQVEITEETKEDEEMGFFQKHKKGLIIGGISALVATAAGVLIATKSSDDDLEEDYDLDAEDDSESAELEN